MTRGATIVTDDVQYRQDVEPEPPSATMEDGFEMPDGDAVGPAGNRRTVREKMREQKRIVDERHMVIQSLLAVPPGRAFVAWLVQDIAGVFTAAINGDLNPQFSMHREGQRAVGLVLQEECLRAAPALYMAAMQHRLTQGNAK